MTFEETALGLYADIVERERIECDMHVTRAFDICMTKEGAESAKLDYQARLAASPASIKQGNVRPVHDPVELRELTGVRGGLWGASYPAGHLWPYKLATAREWAPPRPDTFAYSSSDTSRPRKRSKSSDIHTRQIFSEE